jgi:Spy/CpxP family protein refolding chaperone
LDFTRIALLQSLYFVPSAEAVYEGMKKTFSTLLLLAASAFAQGPGNPPSPANHVARLTTLLNLTAAQQTQGTAIFTSEQAAITPIQAQVQTAHTNLTAAVKGNQTAAIDTLAAQLGTYEAQMASARSKAQAAFYALLTADQQTKYDSLPGAGGAFRGRRPQP